MRMWSGWRQIMDAYRRMDAFRRAPLSALGTAALLAIAGCINSVTYTVPSLPSGSSHSVRLVGYLPDYNQSYAYYAHTLNFTRMTHLILAFGHAPMCNGPCTAQSDMSISLQQKDSDIATLVNAAHAAGVRVTISLGGGDAPGDASISQFYNAGLSSQFAAAIDAYVAAHNLDGVDVDMEEPSTMGTPYGTFVGALAARMHPEGKLLTAAIAPYLEHAIPDSALPQFDFLNVMTYSTESQAISDLGYYALQKGIPANKLVLGVPFFATNADQSLAIPYAQVLAAYPNAWQSDEVSGGSLDGGATLYYVGEATMAQEAQLGAKYGGIMIWELTQDAPAPHSLLDVIRRSL